MIQSVFEWLSNTLESSMPVALLGSFVWGILSVLLSPCHLSSIPLIVGFIGGEGRVSTRKAFGLAGFFSIGILLTIGLIGLVTGLMGRMLGDIGRIGNYLVAVVFIVIGLHLLGVIGLPYMNRAGQPLVKRRGFLAAFLMGLLFGVAVGPCTFAFMAPMLGMVFRMASTRLIFSVALVLAYGVGHCSVIVLAGTFTGLVQKYLNWNERSKGALILRKVCGVLVILGGIYFIWSA
jgi:cytochrome c-type biogenesis protein